MDKQLTIFTPTYNRAKLLPELYNSLKRQKSDTFEWIIIDDESVDNTETVIRSFLDEQLFPIRLYKQKHGGKHRAINKALELAVGEYFFIVDDDDFITDGAVKKILMWIESVKGNENIAAVAGLRISKQGVIWGGGGYTEADLEGFVDAGNLERRKFNLLGDKAEIYKTEIMRQYKFPEYEGEYFVTENVCWNAIAAAGYKIRWFNQPIYVSEYLADGLTKTGANQLEGHIKNFKGYCYYVRQSLEVSSKLEKGYALREFGKTVSQIRLNHRERAMHLNLSLGKYIFRSGIIMINFCFIWLFRKLYKWWRMVWNSSVL